jgi:hypothetical protein
MAVSVIVDASFLITLLSRHDAYRQWSLRTTEKFPPPWKTCEAVLSESFHLLGAAGTIGLVRLLERGAVTPSFHLADNIDAVLTLMHKYSDVPMSFADACLVRMTEILPAPLLLTTDTDFRIYRRLGRQVVPSAMPD